MATIPKLASTVVLMDEMSRVYLTKRPKTMKFLGGYYVFPGGSVEGEDSLINYESNKKQKINGAFSPAHYVAAARELFEEVGIFLGCKKDSNTVHFTNKTEREYRQGLIEGKISFLQMLKQEGLQLNLESLHYFGHRITPKVSPVRFDTRFFLAKLPVGQYPKPDKKEIDEAFWITPEKAIAAYEQGELPMASPTITSLRTIMNHQRGEPLMMPERQC